MSRRYTLEECYTALAVHPKTLRRWIEQDGIAPTQSRADERVKYFTQEQVKELAHLHERPWPPVAASEPEVIPVTAYKLLQEQVAQATRQAEQISADHAQLLTEHSSLREQQQEFGQFRQSTATQLDTIWQEQARAAKTEQQIVQTLGSYGERLVSLQETLTEHQQQTRTALEALTRGQQGATARLDTLTTESAEQQKQLGEQARLIETLQEEVQRNHKTMQEQAEQAKQAQARLQTEIEQRLRAAFQSALTALQEQMQGTLEQQARELSAAIQSAEQDEAQDVAQLTTAQEQQNERLDELQRQATQAASSAEAANVAAQGSQSRLDPMEQRLADLEKRQEAERVACESLTQRREEL